MKSLNFRQSLILCRNTLTIVALIFSTASFSMDAPANIPGATKISSEQVIELVEKHPDLVIIDSRIKGDRKKGFIEGSFSLPDIETRCETLKKFLTNKHTPALYYCNGVKCGRSVKAIEIAQSCGYSNIYWLRGGFEEWLENGLPYLQE